MGFGYAKTKSLTPMMFGSPVGKEPHPPQHHPLQSAPPRTRTVHRCGAAMVTGPS